MERADGESIFAGVKDEGFRKFCGRRGVFCEIPFRFTCSTGYEQLAGIHPRELIQNHGRHT
jgi:hypothetical protein